MPMFVWCLSHQYGGGTWVVRQSPRRPCAMGGKQAQRSSSAYTLEQTKEEHDVLLDRSAIQYISTLAKTFSGIRIFL